MENCIEEEGCGGDSVDREPAELDHADDFLGCPIPQFNSIPTIQVYPIQSNPIVSYPLALQRNSISTRQQKVASVGLVPYGWQESNVSWRYEV